MKISNLVVLIWSLLCGINSGFAQQDFIHTNGSYILGPCEDTLLIKGVNYAPYNWGYSPNELKIEEIAQTGANAVRVVWYKNTNVPLYGDYVALDSVMSKCVQNDLIIILELHDQTCSNGVNGLIQLTDWWSGAEVLTLLEKYKHSVIVNFANEALHVMWAVNPSGAAAAFESTYASIVSSLRTINGFDYPIMIDASDCGQHAGLFVQNNLAQNLIDADPIHNLIFSAHAYWFGYAGNDSTQMAVKVNAVVDAGIPFLLGEVANWQDDVQLCQYELNYQPLLEHCESKNVGWLAWSWDHDGCSARQLSSSGDFADLTPYGFDVVYNPVYGMIHETVKSRYLTENGCGSTASLAEKTNDVVELYPNPAADEVMITCALDGEQICTITDQLDNLVKTVPINGTTRLNLLGMSPGLYFVKINGTAQCHYLIKH